MARPKSVVVTAKDFEQWAKDTAEGGWAEESDAYYTEHPEEYGDACIRQLLDIQARRLEQEDGVALSDNHEAEGAA